ncbi:AraC family transcriptional regulator [Fictibacillus terranigra]|uniref:AraC family transcriptional regulator n=1 Tax=Fictibacillus terranigra TaxID=3058424 RepID=A0ABT8EBN1_9BACL|nr:AraC family transcriptional regulator [Fictibacillus sp. CENA-BCM004]MDN4075324.1 AraC family transcriptional regulator [Fictibacillus sp. CENA-BCM004]
MYVEHLRLERSFAFCRVWGSHEKHDLHIHDCLEIGVLLNNELEYRFSHRTYYGRPGDVFLCRPFEPHWSYAKPDQPFECILILFTPSSVRNIPKGNKLLAPFYAKHYIRPLIPANTPFARKIKSAAINAMKAQENGEDSWLTQQYMHLIEILLQVNEFAKDHFKPSNENLPLSKVGDIVGYMLDHYKDQLDSDTLAKKTGMGRTMFYREFRMLTGLSPNQFLNRLRVQNAMDLLHSTNENMIDLAFASGFQSLSAFNKQFKRFTGQSPRDYRKRMGLIHM